MLPLKDDLPSRTVPFVTVALIALNVLAYLYPLSLGVGDQASPRTAIAAGEALVHEFGLVPCRVMGSCAWDFPHPVITIFTSMFLHGGLLHVGVNMLYLWIFGGNVEDTFGHGRFLVFYLLAGLGAALAQTAMTPDSLIPMIGASGAVSGVLGAYLFLYPHATILTLVTIGFFIRFVHVPAVVVLGFWIIVQVVSGVVSAGTRDGEGGGIAWFAHIGGFLAGIMLLFVMRRRSARRL